MLDNIYDRTDELVMIKPSSPEGKRIVALRYSYDNREKMNKKRCEHILKVNVTLGEDRSIFIHCPKITESKHKPTYLT